MPKDGGGSGRWWTKESERGRWRVRDDDAGGGGEGGVCARWRTMEDDVERCNDVEEGSAFAEEVLSLKE